MIYAMTLYITHLAQHIKRSESGDAEAAASSVHKQESQCDHWQLRPRALLLRTGHEKLPSISSIY